jgi:hypothetical protein
MKKTNNKYAYQTVAAKAVLNMALSQKFHASVLAACPGAGKSTIIIHILNDFFKKFANKKVVILTHNQNILKDQMIEGFVDYNVKPEFTFGELGSGAQVEVGIPSNASAITSMDMLVFDEAHQYFWESMVDAITEKHNPSYTILMTGSPSYFVKYNKLAAKKNAKQFGMYFIAANELIDNGVFSPIDIDPVKYDGSTMIDKIKTVFAHARKSRYDMTKVMWACNSVKEAEAVAYYLKNQFKKDVYMSTSHNDADNEQIDAFKKAAHGVLIVVNKGILGFSDNNITALVDFKCSSDLDTRNQFFARGLRRHKTGMRKAYISVVPSKKWEKEGRVLHQMISLMDREVFMNYGGKAPKDSWRAA